jgi:hypothetical protein
VKFRWGFPPKGGLLEGWVVYLSTGGIVVSMKDPVGEYASCPINSPSKGCEQEVCMNQEDIKNLEKISRELRNTAEKLKRGLRRIRRSVKDKKPQE